MALVINVIASETFPAGVPITLAQLRKAALPMVSATGGVGTSDLADGAVVNIKVTPDAYYYGLDVGTVNAATVTLTPAVAAYKDGLIVAFKVANENTGPVTLSVNGQAAAPVKKNSNQDLAAGDWRLGQIVECRYQLDANIVPAAVYSGGGSYALPVIVGQSYQWVKGANDTSLVNGATTLVATGTFTATDATATLNGTATDTVTATVTPNSNVWQMLSQLGNQTFYTTFQPASPYGAGEAGLVPAPPVGANRKYLRADGTWVDPVAEAVAATVTANTYAEIFKVFNFS